MPENESVLKLLARDYARQRDCTIIYQSALVAEVIREVRNGAIVIPARDNETLLWAEVEYPDGTTCVIDDVTYQILAQILPKMPLTEETVLGTLHWSDAEEPRVMELLRQCEDDIVELITQWHADYDGKPVEPGEPDEVISKDGQDDDQ